MIREGAKQKDNTSVHDKVALRKLGTSGLRELRVLDLFAGDGLIWRHFDCDKYVGVEQSKSKNKNGRVVHDNNMNVIPKLNLSEFNVIDLDSYGIPANQVRALYENGTMASGTIVFYTCISNKVSTLPTTLREYAGIPAKMYHEAGTLFNDYSNRLFFEYLASLGINHVTEYEETVRTIGGYTKKYGFFTT